jgi:hypothetical protein
MTDYITYFFPHLTSFESEKVKIGLYTGKACFKPDFHLRIFSREANFSFVFIQLVTWFQLRDQRQIKNSLRAKKFASGKPALYVEFRSRRMHAIQTIDI